MLTKERLEELIEQEATIWSDNHCPINLINDSKHKIELLANALYVAEEFENCAHTHTWWDDYTIGFDDIYENEEDSKWEEEFGCIERTERLELPTWEEFLELNRHCVEFHFITKEGEINYLVISDMYMHNDMLKPKEEWTIIIKDFDDEYIFEKPATKENYTLACRKCVELFLGEKK